MKLFSVILITSSLTGLLLFSCKEKKNDTLTIDPDPLKLIPAHFQVVAEVDVPATMKIEGIASRLRYEAARKPSLSILPLDDLKLLYMGSGSAKETEESGGLYIAVTQNGTDLSKIVEVYKNKHKDNREVVVGTKKYKEKLIYTLRDRKQEIAACQVGPKTIICGPQEHVLTSLKISGNGISDNKTLKELRAKNEKYSLRIFVLSAENLGAMLENFKSFDRIALGAKATEKGALIHGHSFSEKSEDNDRTHAALGLANLAFSFKFNKFVKPGDVKIRKDDHTTTFDVTLTKDAIKDIFVKD